MNTSKSSLSSSNIKPSWIEDNITKLECNKFVAQPNGNCKCGRIADKHCKAALDNQHKGKPQWNLKYCTKEYRTDAFGTIEFQGGPHPLKAKYVRINYETSASKLLHLLLSEWRLNVPNLVISIIGGLANFDLQQKFKKVFKAGLIKAAKTTGAWVLTSGLDTGVAKHVGEALKDEVHVKGSSIVALGIAPWGIVQHRRQLIGQDKICPYYSISSRNMNQAVLNQYHNYFLLADNGTVDKFGAEKELRRGLERYLTTQSIRFKNHRKSGRSRVPVIAVLIEGGIQAFRQVFELVTDENPVPVVVCEGSGRAADLLAIMHTHCDDEGELSIEIKEHVIGIIENVFTLEKKEAELLYVEIKLCLKRRELITIYRIRDDSPDIDVAILSALLQESGPKLNKQEQLTLCIAWNRPDIAQAQIFDTETELTQLALENAMTDVLINDRLEFLKLLLENGVNIHSYLTSYILEILYNSRSIKGDSFFRSLLAKVLHFKKSMITLRHVGSIIELLMGSGYQHHYCHKSEINNCKLFLDHYDTASSLEILRNNSDIMERQPEVCYNFRYPYTELLQWTILTQRYEMSWYVVLSGEESIAKSLFALKLLRSIRKALNDNTSADLKLWESKYEKLAWDLQDHCYKNDSETTKRLLCYELAQFSGHTCISLAYLCQSKLFLSHICTQNILNDLWYGGLRDHRFLGLKVLIVLLILLSGIGALPVSFICLKSNRFIEFKTKEELALQPQTLEEYLNDSSDSSSESSDSDSDSSDDDTEYHSKTKLDDSIASPTQANSSKKDDKNFVAIELYTTALETNSESGGLNMIVPKDLDRQSGDYEFDIDRAISSSHPNIAMISNDKNSINRNEVEDEVLTFTVPIDLDKPPHVKSSRTKSIIGDNLTLDKESIIKPKRKSDNLPRFHVSPTLPLVGYQQPHNNLTPKQPYGLSNGSVNYLNRTGQVNDLNYDVAPIDFVLTQGTALSWKKKIREFFTAPITKFYMNIISFLTFLMLIMRLSVVKMNSNYIDPFEFYTYIYIMTNFFDNYRKIKQVKGINIIQKIRIHMESFWNIYDFVLTLLTLAGIILRLCAFIQLRSNANTDLSVDVNNIFLWGRNILILASCGWVLRILELMQNWSVFGAYIEMIRCMSQRLAPPIIILAIIMTSFGVLRQGIMYHGLDNLSIGNILKQIYLKPYFMLYGEVYAGEIDPVDFPKESQNTPLVWIVPFMMVIFMLGAVVMILSLIIASITDIFGKVKESSVKVYMYLRYPMIIEYESRPFLPPPFIIVLWCYEFARSISAKVKSCFRQMSCCKSKRSSNAEDNNAQHSAGLKLFLSQNEIEKLHDYEEECVQDYWRKSKDNNSKSIENLYNKVVNHMDYTTYQQADLINKFDILRQVVYNNAKQIHEISNQVQYRLKPNHKGDTSPNRRNLSSLNYRNPQHKFNRMGSYQQAVEQLIDPLEIDKDCYSDIAEHQDEYNTDYYNNRNNNGNPSRSGKNLNQNFDSNNYPGIVYNKNSGVLDDVIISGWKSSRDSHPVSPTASLLNLSVNTTRKRSRHVNRKNRKNHRNKIKDPIDSKNDNFRIVEKLEREEMGSVMVQRLRQLSCRTDTDTVSNDEESAAIVVSCSTSTFKVGILDDQESN